MAEVARLARKTAGQRVARRAQRLSDDLLVVEEQCFADVAAVILQGAVAAQRKFLSVITSDDKVAGAAANAALRQELGASHLELIGGVTGRVRTLLEVTADATIESLGEELLWCEGTLAKKYAGVAESTMAWLKKSRDDFVAAGLVSYVGVGSDSTAEFDREMTRQLLLARQYGDTPEQAASRLFAPKVSRPGVGGRGVWLRSGSWVNEYARRSSVSVMNGLRTSGMAAFNKHGAARG